MEEKQSEAAESNSEEEFFDAKDSWEDDKAKSNLNDNLKPNISFISTLVTPDRGSLIQKQTINKALLSSSSFWNNKTRREDIKDSYKKMEATSMLKMRDSFELQMNPLLKTEVDFSKVTHSSKIITQLPTLPLGQSLDKVPTIKCRTRVPPIAIIRTQKSLKDRLEFNNLTLQQELRSGVQAIWVARFSVDGNFFAVGGEERVVRVWQVGDYSQQCNLIFKNIAAELLFNPKPLREYKEHTGDILDLSWCSHVYYKHIVEHLVLIKWRVRQ
jgi:WD40 repeat protein